MLDIQYICYFVGCFKFSNLLYSFYNKCWITERCWSEENENNDVWSKWSNWSASCKTALQAGYVAKCLIDATMKDEWIHKMPIVFNN
jgi:hypothetical protein